MGYSVKLRVFHSKSIKAALPSLFGTRDRFRGRPFFHGRQVWGDGSGGNASDGEPQMKLRSPARRSPPAVRPGVLTGPVPNRPRTGTGPVRSPEVGEPCVKGWLSMNLFCTPLILEFKAVMYLFGKFRAAALNFR